MTKHVTEKWKHGHPPGPSPTNIYTWDCVSDTGPDRSRWRRCAWCNTAVRYAHGIRAQESSQEYFAGIDCGSYLTGQHALLRGAELKLRADTARRKRAGEEPKPTPGGKTPRAPRAPGKTPNPKPDTPPRGKESPMPDDAPKYPPEKQTWMTEGWIEGRYYAGPEAGYNVPGFRKKTDWDNAPGEILVIKLKGAYALVLDQKLGAKRWPHLNDAISHAWDYCQWKMKQVAA